jgi:GTP-binding protein LepA
MNQNLIRNFVIISHIDHGKSTLADRFLELTDTIPKEKMRPQYLDMMDLEREKGITIKMQPVKMSYILNSKFYILNLIDTPGHVDFSYEVSRALAAVEGAILLVDATKGIQAQTLANLELAKKQNLVIIPVVNKIDSPQARIEETKKEISNLLKIPENEIFEISAKYGTNVRQLLEVVIEKTPSPKEDLENELQALIFDSKYDFYKGVIAYSRVVNGEVRSGDKIFLIQTKTESEVKEVGYFIPELSPQKELKSGEIGYIATGIKEPGRVRVGDTITLANFHKYTTNFTNNIRDIGGKFVQISGIQPLAGYQEPKPMVFASLYPENPEDFDSLKESLNKLKLNDPSLTFMPETKAVLGRGFRCGFLGNLHIEIVSERLSREFGLNLIISTPQVLYKIINQKNQEISVYSSSDWPPTQEIKEIREPWAKLEVITPLNYLGQVSELLKNLGGNQVKTEYFSSDRLVLIWEIPLREMVVGLFDKLKGISQGFASMNYQILDWRRADLVRVDILILGKKEEAFSQILPRSKVFKESKKIVKKLKEILPAQLFSVPLQAAIEGKIIARETIRARRKDVIAPLYGGDYTRKRKLLDKQKKGKKKLKEKGEVHIPQKVFLEMFKSK